MGNTAVYAEIVKHERDANGDLVVYGRATGPDLDLDRQVCDPAWLKQAMPEWFSSGANVREQHSSIAAGVGTEIAEKPDGGWDLKALVVDPTSARKVERGVLKGYSVGIRNPQVVKDAKAPGGRITGGQIVEVSLVDRPANPTCQLTLAKALKPGPAAPVGAVDAERHLVKVEELHDRAGEVLDALKALDLVAARKGDNAGQIRDAEQAIAIIAGLIQGEAAQLAGDVDYEACDIELLLDAVRALSYFKCREKKEPAMAHVDLSADADVEKAAAPDAAQTAAPTEEQPETPAPVAEKAAETPAPVAEKAAETPAPVAEKAAEADEKTDLTELVEAAVAKALAPVQVQLAKAMEQPAPGGPVLTRTVQDTTKAEAREAHLAKAAHYERLADEVHDSNARAGYLRLADEERAAAS